VSNIVFMGMGEPLLNLPSVLRAHEVLNKDVGIGGAGLGHSCIGGAKFRSGVVWGGCCEVECLVIEWGGAGLSDE